MTYTTNQPQKVGTRFGTRIFDILLALCGILQYRAKRQNACFQQSWYCAALCDIIVIRASLSAINLENQGFAK